MYCQRADKLLLRARIRVHMRCRVAPAVAIRILAAVCAVHMLLQAALLLPLLIQTFLRMQMLRQLAAALLRLVKADPIMRVLRLCTDGRRLIARLRVRMLRQLADELLVCCKRREQTGAEHAQRKSHHRKPRAQRRFSHGNHSFPPGADSAGAHAACSLDDPHSMSSL